MSQEAEPCVSQEPKVTQTRKPSKRNFKYAHSHIKFILETVILLNPFQKRAITSISQTWQELTSRFNQIFYSNLNSSKIIAMVSLWLKKFVAGKSIIARGHVRTRENKQLICLLSIVCRQRDEARHLNPQVTDYSARTKLQFAVSMVRQVPPIRSFLQTVIVGRESNSEYTATTLHSLDLPPCLLPAYTSIPSPPCSDDTNNSPRRISIRDLIN